MSAKIWLACGILLGLHGAGLAQDAPDAKAKAPDFSEGFKRLVALGLPPLDDKAVWVTDKNGRMSYQFQRSLKGFKGNAWLTGEGKDARMVAFGALEISAAVPRGASSKPDLEKDVTTLTDALRKADPQGTDSDGILGSRYSSGNMASEILVFATQLYQTGHADAANRLAIALFDAMPSREDVIDQVVGKIASSAYDTVAERFFEDGDWAAYHRDAAALITKFPRGWSAREAVSVLMPQLERRASGGEIPAISLQGATLSPQAAAIAAELLAKPAPAKAGPNGIDPAELRNLPPEHRAMVMRQLYGRESPMPDEWLITPPPATKGNPQPVAKLAALGVEALPVLAALVGDPVLTHRRFAESSGNYDSYVFRNSNSEDPVTLAYRNLNRPASRGEIAAMMLRSALPDSDDSLDEADDETLKTAALEFWQAHHNRSREDLAAVFLREGSTQQASAAATVLASAKDEKYHKIFEDHILALDPAYPAYQDVSVYLKSRGKPAKPFFDAYAKLIRAQAPDPNADDNGSFDQNTYMLRDAGGVEKIIKSLSPLVEDKTPRTIAIEIAKGKPAEAAAAIEALAPLLEGLKPLKRLHTLLGGASAATDTAVRARFLQACLNIEWYDEDEEEEEPAVANDEQPKPGPVRTIGPVEAGVWRKLIADTAKIPKEHSASNSRQQSPVDPLLATETIGDLACYALEASMETDHGIYGIARAAELLGKKPADLVREFATARLDGKAPPALPDADKVSEDRLKEIVAAAGALKPTEISAHIKTLTPDEQAKWQEWVTDPEDIEVPASVKAMAWVVVGDLKIPGIIPWPAKIQNSIKVGFLVSPESLLALFKDYAAKPDESSPAAGVFLVQENGSGLTTTDMRLDLTSKPPEKGASNGEANEDGDPDAKASTDPAKLIAGWRDAFKICVEALEKESSAVIAVELSAFRRDGTTTQAMFAMDKDGNAIPIKGDSEDVPAPDALAAIKTILAQDSPPSQITWRVLARKHLDALMKDSTPETPDPSETLPPP